MSRSFRFSCVLIAFALCVFCAAGAYAKNIIPLVPDGEAESADYVVTIDKYTAPVWTCRVSAIPFNRIWPGYQRSLDQTETASFVTWETDAESSEIVVKSLRNDATLENVVIRPLSLGIKPTIDKEKKEISFKSSGTTPIVVEIDGSHFALHLLPFPIYKRPADLNAPNLRYFGPGIHNAGLIEVKSGDEIFVDSGAVVYGGVRGEGVENVKVSGPGIIDVAPFERGKIGGVFRFTNSKNITIDGIVQRDPDVWSTTLYQCDNVHIANTKLIGLWRYNADGIDVCNSENVTVEKSFLRTYDDSLVVKGIGESTRPVKNLVFRQNVIWCDWGRAMELGAETRAPEFNNVRFEDCDVVRNTHIAMDIQHGDRAKISNVVFDNIRVEFDDKIPTPVYQNSDDQVYDPNANPDFCPALAVIVIQSTHYSGDKENGNVRNVLFKDIKVYGSRKPAISLTGCAAESDVQGVTFKNVTLVDQNLKVDSREILPYSANQFVSDVSFVP